MPVALVSKYTQGFWTDWRTPAARGQVDHGIEGRALSRGVAGEQRLDGRAIRDIQALEGQARAALDLVQAPLLQADVIGVVEIVYPHDRVTLGQQ